MKKLPVIALAMFFAVGSTLALAQEQAAVPTQVRHTQVRLAHVRQPRVRPAQVGPVAVIPQWISKMQVGCRGRERPSIGPIVAAPLTVAGCDCKLPIRWSRSAACRCSDEVNRDARGAASFPKRPFQSYGGFTFAGDFRTGRILIGSRCSSGQSRSGARHRRDGLPSP